MSAPFPAAGKPRRPTHAGIGIPAIRRPRRVGILPTLNPGSPLEVTTFRGTAGALFATTLIEDINDPEVRRAWLTVAMFGAGQNSAAARVAKELADLPARVLIDEVARRRYKDPGERRRETDLALEAADRAMAAALHSGATAVPYPHPNYPPQLREIPDPPPLLWARGDVASMSAPAIGVVGSRDATPASLAVARKLGSELAEAGLVVVSGLARGIDGASHAGALAGAGRTVAVMGSGLDVVYPLQHRALAEQVSQNGALVSELPPWVGPRAWHFPLRNRIISGLSRAVVVVEASEKSGSLITARLALEQGRDVLAVPGGILSGRHRGTHGLIKDGARLVETVDDVLEEIGWRRPPVHAVGDSSNPLPINILESSMAAGEPYTVGQLGELVGRTAAETLVELSYLELAGRVVRQPGGQFVRIAKDR
jgi:DNA processing protein